MQITLYNVSSDKRRISKPLTNEVGIYGNVHLKENTSIVNPVFLVSGITNNQFNYLYCPYFERCYFVNKVVYCKGQLWEIHCHVDVLMSFDNDILSHSAFIERQENASSKEFYDSSYPVQAKNTCYEVPIGVVGNSFGYYLTVNGGVQ